MENKYPVLGRNCKGRVQVNFSRLAASRECQARKPDLRDGTLVTAIEQQLPLGLLDVEAQVMRFRCLSDGTLAQVDECERIPCSVRDEFLHDRLLTACCRHFGGAASERVEGRMLAGVSAGAASQSGSLPRTAAIVSEIVSLRNAGRAVSIS